MQLKQYEEALEAIDQKFTKKILELGIPYS